MPFDFGWYPVALSRDVDSSTSTGTLLLSKEIVVWRDEAGKAHVWEDRCPHRGMRLSFGFVRGNHIACLYHGWQYDTEGQCRHIPAHPQIEVPRAIKAQRYISEERAGLIWVHSASEAEEYPPLEAPADALLPVRSLYLDCAPDRVLARVDAGDLPRPPDFGGEPKAHRAGSLMSLAWQSGELVIGIQPVDAGRTALHILLRCPDEADAASLQQSSARWAETLRDTIEAPERFVPAPTLSLEAAV